ncbi:MAG: 2-oxo acid dehydrogenase subunit E2 [Eggerthellaceae bacterium]|nr:2-oxo acid dehydrogenase subunit E2 [Eggerthellaceae bacterium]
MSKKENGEDLTISKPVPADYKRRRGDRSDARYVREADGFHKVMDLLFPTRCNNETYLSEVFDLGPVKEYMAKKNAEIEGIEDEIPYTIFHFVVAALVKTITLRPKMNTYIARGRIYQRYHVSASFVVKKYFGDDAEEGLAFINEAENMNLESMHEAIRKQVKFCRGEQKDSSADSMDLVAKLPYSLVRFVVWACRQLDKFDLAPRSFIATDPYHTTALLSNVGSIKLNAGYHHLANWGTNSVIVLVGKKQPRIFFNEDYSFDVKESIELGITIDERLADGYYYSRTIQLFKKIFENPELLEEPFETEVEY